MRPSRTPARAGGLPAYEAASEFIVRTAGELDNLLTAIGGNKGALNTLDKLKMAKDATEDELAELLNWQRQSREHNETLEKSVIAAARNIRWSWETTSPVR